MVRMYYAGHSYMGLNMTYDSSCWEVFGFDTKKERDAWVEEHEYSIQASQYVAAAITHKIAMRILKPGKYGTIQRLYQNKLVVR